jgi:hypothetical protein
VASDPHIVTWLCHQMMVLGKAFLRSWFLSSGRNGTRSLAMSSITEPSRVCGLRGMRRMASRFALQCRRVSTGINGVLETDPGQTDLIPDIWASESRFPEGANFLRLLCLWESFTPFTMPDHASRAGELCPEGVSKKSLPSGRILFPSGGVAPISQCINQPFRLRSDSQAIDNPRQQPSSQIQFPSSF